jgi:glycosyltransferase involved in cell wall biosynthesis
LNKKGISAVIITFNEASSIDRCLSSLHKLADEIIVVDSFSSDATEDACKKYGARFVKHEFTGFMDQKNYALTLAGFKYVLSLDADEALSDELQESISSVKADIRYDGYLFNRLSNYCGQWIRHSAWYPDRQLRLFNREMGKWGVMNVHESFQMTPGSKIGRLKGDILHWPGNSASDYLRKTVEYSAIAAREMYKSGLRVSFITPVVHFTWRLFLTYILHLGFLDGRSGWQVCLTGARSTYNKYSLLRSLTREGKSSGR